LIDLNAIQTARIRGKAVLTENPNLFLHLDRIVTFLEGHLKKKGLRDVRIMRSDWVVFSGRKWNILRVLNHRNRDLADFVDLGGIRITMQGPRVVGEYYLKTARGWFLDVVVIVAIFVAVFLALDFELTQVDLAWLVALLGLFKLAERFIRAHWIMKRELPGVLKKAEHVIEATVIMRDTSAVEPGHRDLKPLDLLRSARFFEDQGDPDKGRAYLAYLVEKHPHSEEAEMASEELREMGV
jgi:hypothetical protein